MTTPGTNYAAFGEYTAYGQQARDAAARRFALLHNLASDLRKLADDADRPVVAAGLDAALADIEAADRELRAALARANQAGALCGQRDLRAAGLLGSKG